MHLSVLERALLLFLTTSAGGGGGSAVPDLSDLALDAGAGAAGIGADAGADAGLENIVGLQVPSNLATLGSFVHALPDVRVF